MSQLFAIQMEVPDDLARFRLPPTVDTRLQFLLDRQDSGERLTTIVRKKRKPGKSSRDAFASTLACSAHKQRSAREKITSNFPTASKVPVRQSF